MVETVDDFYDRTYWNYVKGKVLVYPSKSAKKSLSFFKPEVWSLEKAEQYLNYLESVEERSKWRVK